MTIFPQTQVPLIVSGCLLWLKADDQSSASMTASSGRVSALRNFASRTAITQATGAAQPSNTVTIKGLPALGFDNDNERYLNTNIPSTLGNATIFVVVQQAVSGVQGMVTGTGGSTQSIRMANNNLGYTCLDGTTVITLASGTSVLTSPAIFAVTCDVAGSTRNLYKNSTTVGATGAYDGSIGTLYLGTASSGAGQSRGGFNLGEMAIYNKVLNSTELAQVFSYLGNKWGIAIS